MNVLPSLIAGCCLLFYWGTVVRKALRFTRKEAHGANLIPRERAGRWIRVLWIPTIVAWCVQPWLALRNHFHHSAHDLAWTAVGLVGTAICVSASTATFSCWREMGRSWRIGIDPEEKTQLIFSGPFRIVRHPIHALSILLVLGTLATTPTLVMLVLAIVHIACLQFEAHSEETYLLGKHGHVYADYMKRVGRFSRAPLRSPNLRLVSRLLENPHPTVLPVGEGTILFSYIDSAHSLSSGRGARVSGSEDSFQQSR